MQGFVFISSLFSNVLQCSKSIEGRFFTSNHEGWEINTDQLGELVNNILEKKYPLAIMLPPFIRGNDIRKQEWVKVHIRMYFLKRTYNNGNGTIQNANPLTNTSTHTILEDWHDMHRSAIGFLKALHSVVKDNMTTAGVFRLSSDPYSIKPVSRAGNDLVSGVRLEFMCELPPVCELEDFETTLLNNVVIPSMDPHPEHSM